MLLICYICTSNHVGPKAIETMKTRKYLVYESPQTTVVELKMDSALLQASVQDYIEGGHETWVTSGEEDGIFF